MKLSAKKGGQKGQRDRDFKKVIDHNITYNTKNSEKCKINCNGDSPQYGQSSID